MQMGGPHIDFIARERLGAEAAYGKVNEERIEETHITS